MREVAESGRGTSRESLRAGSSTTQSVAIAILVVSLFSGPIVVLSQVSPEGPWILLAAAVAAVSLEALTTTRWLRREKRWLNPFTYRAAEAIVLILALRLVTWLSLGNAPRAADWRALLLDPTAILDLPFVFFAIIAMLAWERTLRYGGIFEALGLSRLELAHFQRPPGEREGLGSGLALARDRIAIHKSFYQEWIIGGMILAFFTALATFDLPPVETLGSSSINLRTLGRLDLPPALLAALILYFVSGLWLGSQGRLSVLRARWLYQGIEVEEPLARKWRKNSLLLLVVAAIAGAFLPIGSTTALGAIVGAAVTLILTLPGILIGLMLFLLSLITPRSEGELDAESLPFDLPRPPAVPASPTAADDTAAIILGSLFWIVAAVVSAGALYFFLSGRGVSLDARWPLEMWRFFAGWLNRLLRGVREGAEAAGSVLLARLSPSGRRRAFPERPWHLIRFNSLSAREKIRFLYLAAARRAGERGVRRAEGETPLEYAADLKAAWPEADEDLETLTEAFLAARYSGREIQDDDAAVVKRVWRRLRSVLGRDGPAGRLYRSGG